MANRLIAIAIAALLVTPLALTACTAGETQPGPSESNAPGTVQSADQDTCDLLPAEELAAVLGEQADPTPIPSDGWTAGQCAWSGESTGFILSIGTQETIAAFDDPAQPDSAAMLDAFASAAGDLGRAVEDAGDAAFLNQNGIAARLGGNYVEIQKLSLTEEQLIGILRLALENLSA